MRREGLPVFDCSKAEPFREWKRPERRKYGAKDLAKDVAVVALCSALAFPVAGLFSMIPG